MMTYVSKSGILGHGSFSKYPTVNDNSESSMESSSAQEEIVFSPLSSFNTRRRYSVADPSQIMKLSQEKKSSKINKSTAETIQIITKELKYDFDSSPEQIVNK